MTDVSAYNVAQANLELALDFAKNFASDDLRVGILLPDEAEAKIAVEALGGSFNPQPGIVISSLRKSEEGDERIFKVKERERRWFHTNSRCPQTDGSCVFFCCCTQTHAQTRTNTHTCAYIAGAVCVEFVWRQEWCHQAHGRCRHVRGDCGECTRVAGCGGVE